MLFGSGYVDVAADVGLPTGGHPLANLRDGTILQVLEHRQVDDGEWLRVKTPDGIEGWIFSRLVAPAA